MLSGPVHDEHGMCTLFDMPADLVDMELHGLGVGEGQSQSCTNAAGRADRAEQVGALISLVGGLPRACAAGCPLPHDAVLLADAGFILEPQFYLRARRQVAKMRLQRAWPVFLNAAMISASCAGCCGRALMWLKPSLCSSLPT